jgi:hypothetical protein
MKLNAKKRNVRSFDVFDTLIARRVKSPTDIFDIVEKTFPFENFSSVRKESERQSPVPVTLHSIYTHFQKITNCSNELREALQEVEMQTEIENSYLIMTNYLQVNDDDILITDMYMSSEDVHRILKSIGFNKNVTIYSSASGMSKHSGDIFNSLRKQYNFKLHIGDNYHSDVLVPRKFGIPSQLTVATHMTSIEQLFHNSGKQKVAHFFREFRLRNPHQESCYKYKLYEDQAGYNIPFLVLTCYFLEETMKKENRDTLLPLTRDGNLLHDIFLVLFPEIRCQMLQSSRIVHKKYNEEYKKYLKETVYDLNKCLLFDLHGNFQSGRPLYREIFGCLPRIHISTLVDKNYEYDLLSYTDINQSAYLEAYNTDVVGTLVEVRDNKFLRAALEYKLEDAMVYKTCVESFCKYIPNVKEDSILAHELKNCQHLLLPICKLLEKRRPTINVNSNFYTVNPFKTVQELKLFPKYSMRLKK